MKKSNGKLNVKQNSLMAMGALLGVMILAGIQSSEAQVRRQPKPNQPSTRPVYPMPGPVMDPNQDPYQDPYQGQLGRGYPQPRPGQPYPIEYYENWCDRVSYILNAGLMQSQMAYFRTDFTAAKSILVSQIQQAIQVAQFNRFKPYTYIELHRTMALYQKLNQAMVSNPTQKEKLLAYVLTERVQFILGLTQTIDRPYVIPCFYGCAGGSRVDLNSYESRLIEHAQSQIDFALNLSSASSGGVIHPLVNTGVFISVLTMATEWASQDLSQVLFRTAFECDIWELNNLKYEIQSMRSSIGDFYTVQHLHQRASAIRDALDGQGGCR